ncbi:hypothetical protein VNO80_14946 [Phaseolus coccineus]|uniref:Uncharacterized protein n=1 Tax=Phaseolus coccineus TaxID=3886 RepID=A0AAN9R1V7_PHACN
MFYGKGASMWLNTLFRLKEHVSEMGLGEKLTAGPKVKVKNAHDPSNTLSLSHWRHGSNLQDFHDGMGHEGTSSSACFVDPSKIGREKTSE